MLLIPALQLAITPSYVSELKKESSFDSGFNQLESYGQPASSIWHAFLASSYQI
jgi:hypothetical protein